MKKIKMFVEYFMKKSSDGANELASAYLGYYLLLSFIPLLMFMAQIIVEFVPNFESTMYNLTSQLPEDIENLFNPVIENIMNSKSSSLSIFAIGSVLFAGSKGFLGLKKSLNQIFEVESKSKIPFYDIIFSMFFTVAFIVFLTLVLLFNVFNEKIIALIRDFTNNISVINTISNIFLDWIGLIAPFIFSILIFAFLYRYSPSFNKKNRISIFQSVLGSTVATVAIALVTFFYRFTNDVITRSPSIYGSLGSILVTLIWLMTVCQMIVFGAVFIKTYIDVIKTENFS